MTTIAARNSSLKEMLTERRRQIQEDVQERIRGQRTDAKNEVGDDLDRSDVGIQRDMGLALLQMKTETLLRIDEALVRLDADEYGFCFECNGEISAQRLRALPFAVRCRACEEQREQEHRDARRLVEGHGGLVFFPDPVRQ